MTTLPLVLAHAGEGATWQAMVTVLAAGLALVVVLAAAGRVRVTAFGDLLLPLAVVVIAASVAPTVSDVLSDYVGFAIPVGAVALVALLLAAGTGLELRPLSPLAVGAGVLAVVLALVAGPGLNRRLHPLDTLPLASDATIEVVEPTDGATVAAGTVRVQVAVSGATIGPEGLERGPDDPEELGHLRAYLGAEELDARPLEECTEAAPCTEVSFDVEVPAGEHTLFVEFVRWDGSPFAVSVFDRVSFTAS